MMIKRIGESRGTLLISENSDDKTDYSLHTRNKREEKTKMKTQITTGKSQTPLNKVWGKKELVISLSDAKRLIKAFKQEGIKKDRDCLIFESPCFWKYRVVGEQHEYKFVDYKTQEKTIKEMEAFIRRYVPTYSRGRRTKQDIKKLYDDGVQLFLKREINWGDKFKWLVLDRK